ncbi:MAG: DUF4416 family protein [Planctomycetota bacterium]
MGIVKPYPPVVLLCGLLGRFEDALGEGEKRLTAAFGPISLRSELMDFTATAYYREEMGDGLKRIFLAFEKPFDPAALAHAKHTTNRLETEIAASGRWPAERPVNIDPGYVALSKLVLATTKDYSHRIPIGDGMFAEVTLRYTNGGWQAWPWTYPDYRLPAYHAFLTAARQSLLPGGTLSS